MSNGENAVIIHVVAEGGAWARVQVCIHTCVIRAYVQLR